MPDSPIQGVDTTGLVDYIDRSSTCCHFSAEHVEQCSSCKEDGISPAYESSLRKSYCSFMQKLGRQLKLPQVTIATAIIFCHRFFLRQSLASNDRFIIATVCLFLAGKVEETPERLQNVIVASYELRNAEDPDASSKIKQKEVYDEQKELLLMGERLVLVTLGFNLNVAHPYKPLISAIKRLSFPQTVSRSQLAQIAWNFINDGLQTLLCVQFKPHHVAAGALFLTAKFFRYSFFDWRGILSREFDISLQQLEDVSNQILYSYEPLKDASTNSSRGDKLIQVGVANSKKQASTDSCIFSVVDLGISSQLGACEGDSEWLSSSGRKQMEEEMGTSMLHETHKTGPARFEMENEICHTGHSDITEENEVQDLGQGCFSEEDYFERGQSHGVGNSCGSLSPIGSDEHSIGRACLVGREMKLKRDSRDNSSDTNTTNGTVAGVRRHNPWVQVSCRYEGLGQMFSGSPFGMKSDPRKAVTKQEISSPLRKKIKPTRGGLTTPDRQSRRFQNRLKLLRQKDKILKSHHSWASREHFFKHPG